jgi:hypothetical protein
MRRLFRGKFLAMLAELDLPLSPAQKAALRRARSKAAQKRWVVYVEAADGRSPHGLVRYLARYVNQMAISDHRMVSMSADTVTIRTRGSETITMSGTEFVRRFAQHVLPKRFKRVRSYGLLATRLRPRLEQARRVLSDGEAATVEPAEEELPEPVKELLAVLRFECPCCHGRLFVTGVPPQYPNTARGPP